MEQKQQLKYDQDNLLQKKQFDLKKFGATGLYGAMNEMEFFAEAFADVYQNGASARKASIELVKLYEEMRDQYNNNQP